MQMVGEPYWLSSHEATATLVLKRSATRYHGCGREDGRFRAIGRMRGGEGREGREGGEERTGEGGRAGRTGGEQRE